MISPGLSPAEIQVRKAEIEAAAASAEGDKSDDNNDEESPDDLANQAMRRITERILRS